MPPKELALAVEPESKGPASQPDLGSYSYSSGYVLHQFAIRWSSFGSKDPNFSPSTLPEPRTWAVCYSILLSASANLQAVHRYLQGKVTCSQVTTNSLVALALSWEVEAVAFSFFVQKNGIQPGPLAAV